MNTKPSKIILPFTVIILTLTLLGSIFYFAARTPWAKTPETNPDNSTSVTEPSSPENNTKPYHFDYSWTKHPYIAHAFGGIFGDSYTNSYEAFLLNYQLGHRIFEVDFYLTDDGKTVATHDAEAWQTHATLYNCSNDNIACPKSAEVNGPNSAEPNTANSTEPHNPTFTYDNFMSSLWDNKYHPVDLNTLLHIMQQYPDIYIVTDTKFSDQESVKQQFQAFIDTAKTIDISLLDRFIIQVYHPEMLDWIMEVYPWKSVIYTLYADPNWTPENVLEFSQNSGVKFITMWGSWVTPEILDLWKPNGIQIAVHTINDYLTASNFLKLGITGIYTDFLTP